MSEQKEKKRFTIQSPYADYAADNDLCTEEMEKNSSNENLPPDRKQIIKSALTAAGLVCIFALIGVVFSWAGTCISSCG